MYSSIGPVTGAVLAAVWMTSSAASATTSSQELSSSTPRTAVIAIEANWSSARVVGWEIKSRAPLRRATPDPEAAGARFELRLVSSNGVQSRSVLLPGLCLLHGPETANHERVPESVPGHAAGGQGLLPAHVEVHQETFLVEFALPPGPAQLEIWNDAPGQRVKLGEEALDLAGDKSSLGTSGQVHWPEDYGDPIRYRVVGSEAEVDRRLNIVVVPDGYVYSEKWRMDQDFDSLVALFRATTPYKEHDAFLNYILVYAYGNQSGTDQCDCGVVVDTAMNTRFPAVAPTCGDMNNRCVYYGTFNGGPNCDETTSPANIAAAELRAPGWDATIIPVNTMRGGGCGGGLRAVYAAGGGSAVVAVHELGHVLPSPRLEDEYAYYASCGTGSGPNVSQNAVTGGWSEWISDLGSPRQGAKLYNQCVYRPGQSSTSSPGTDACMMGDLNAPFCPVCVQHFALSIFASPRIAPTAPIAGQVPAGPVSATAGQPTSFAVETRLGSAAHQITWTVSGGALPAPITVCGSTDSCSYSFPGAGEYTMRVEVIADALLVKPAKYGANRESAEWSVTVAPCVPVAESCSNGSDDDCDGAADCADLDCLLQPHCCKTLDQGCTSSTECCTGLSCTNGKCAAPPPPPPPCKAAGSACISSSECCAPSTCSKRKCTSPPPPCKPIGQSCTTSSQCCSKRCTGGRCK